MTKAQKRDWVYHKYKQSPYHMITQFYKSWSPSKIVIDNRIRRAMEQVGGKRYRIVGGNSFSFICAYCFFNFDTGKWYLRYITKSSETDYELTEEEVDELHLR